MMSKGYVELQIRGGSSKVLMERIRIKAVCAYSTLRQSRSAVWELLAGLWLAGWLTVITWFAEGFQGYLGQQVILTALYFVWPIAILTAAVSGDRSDHPSGESRSTGGSLRNFGLWGYYGSIIFVPLGALALLSERYGWTSFRLGLSSALISALALPFFSYFVYRKPILGIALFPAIAVALAANIATVLHVQGDWWESSIVLFTDQMLVAAPWSGLGLLLLQWAEKSHGRNRLGPFTEFAAMAFLFVPLMWSVWVLGESLPDSETWQPVCVTVIGVLMSIIVSDPLKRFLKACWDPSSSH